MKSVTNEEFIKFAESNFDVIRQHGIPNAQEECVRLLFYMLERNLLYKESWIPIIQHFIKKGLLNEGYGK